MEQLNKKGFFMTETLVVIVFVAAIFTFLYVSVIPLVGTYNDKVVRESNIDIVYKLYHIRKMMIDDEKISGIVKNNDFYKITCEDFNDSDKCNSLIESLYLTDYILLFVNSVKKNINSLNTTEYSEIYKVLSDREEDEAVLILFDNVRNTYAKIKYPYKIRVLADIIKKKCDDDSVSYVQKYDSLTYGEATDSMENIVNQDICYYTDDTSERLANQNSNLLFAGDCWQIIRTTGTGGTKIVYNGKAEDGKCLKTRSPIYVVGLVGSIYSLGTNLQSNYVYGRSFFYDYDTKKFTLDELVNDVFSYDNNENFIGTYTCKSSSTICETIYYVGNNVPNSSYTYTIPYTMFMPTTGYTDGYNYVGKTPYNPDTKSLSMVGYMYDASYDYSWNNYWEELRIYDLLSVNNRTFKYGDDITWDSSTRRYTLTNEQELVVGSTLEGDLSIYKHKYFVATGYNVVYYCVEITNYYLYGIALRSGNNLADATVSYTFGKELDSNGHLVDTKVIKNTEWYDLYNSDDITSRKYVCLGNTTSCSSVWYSMENNSYNYYFKYFELNNKYMFGNSVIYDAVNDVYRIDESKETINDAWPFVYDKLANKHYSCLKPGKSECTNMCYVYETTKGMAYYIVLSKGDTFETALAKMLNYKQSSSDPDREINKYNSAAKGIVDNWYKNNMVSYTRYLEDTVFCNNREIFSLGGWNPASSTDNGTLKFVTSYYSSSNHDIKQKSLTCLNETDKFSLYNNLAKLKYPVGLMTEQEASYILARYGWDTNAKNFWTSTPYMYRGNYAEVNKVQGNNDYTPWEVYYNYNIRPVVSLKPGTEVDGKGTYDEPYVVDLEGTE